jgi:UDP-glucose 4-epimerase
LSETALVAGGAGFIGSHLVDALLAEGRRVIVVDDLSTGDTGRLPDQAELEVLDIVNAAALERVVKATKPRAIFHVAAQSSVTVSVSDPLRDCAVNVEGTLNVLEAANRHRAPVVFTSTGGALYGNEAPLPTVEDRIPAPLAPYGASKWAGEAHVLTWSRAGGVPHVVCRLGNVYGPRQSPPGEAGVVAIFSYKLWTGQPPTLFGYGKPTRDYVHVSDVVRALVVASGTPGVFNIATGINTPVEVVLGILQEVAGTSLTPERAPLRPGELERSCMDPSRAAQLFGWRARFGVREGLVSTYRALIEHSVGVARRPRRRPRPRRHLRAEHQLTGRQQRRRDQARGYSCQRLYGAVSDQDGPCARRRSRGHVACAVTDRPGPREVEAQLVG